jgi:hypothetical protein
MEDDLPACLADLTTPDDSEDPIGAHDVEADAANGDAIERF